MGLIGMRIAQEATRKALNSSSSVSYDYGFDREVREIMAETEKINEENVIEKTKKNAELYDFFSELALIMRADAERDLKGLIRDLKSITEKLLEMGIEVDNSKIFGMIENTQALLNDDRVSKAEKIRHTLENDFESAITFNGEHYTKLELSNRIDLNMQRVREWDEKNKDIDKKIEIKKKKIESMKAKNAASGKNKKDNKIKKLEAELRLLYKKKEYREELLHKSFNLSKLENAKSTMLYYMDIVKKIDYTLCVEANPNIAKNDEEDNYGRNYESSYDFGYLMAVGIKKGTLKKENILKCIRMLKSPSVPEDSHFIPGLSEERAMRFFCRYAFPEITKPNKKQIEKDLLKKRR